MPLDLARCAVSLDSTQRSAQIFLWVCLALCPLVASFVKLLKRHYLLRFAIKACPRGHPRPVVLMPPHLELVTNGTPRDDQFIRSTRSRTYGEYGIHSWSTAILMYSFSLQYDKETVSCGRTRKRIVPDHILLFSVSQRLWYYGFDDIEVDENDDDENGESGVTGMPVRMSVLFYSGWSKFGSRSERAGGASPFVTVERNCQRRLGSHRPSALLGAYIRSGGYLSFQTAKRVLLKSEDLLSVRAILLVLGGITDEQYLQISGNNLCNMLKYLLKRAAAENCHRFLTAETGRAWLCLGSFFFYNKIITTLSLLPHHNCYLMDDETQRNGVLFTKVSLMIILAKVSHDFRWYQFGFAAEEFISAIRAAFDNAMTKGDVVLACIYSYMISRSHVETWCHRFLTTRATVELNELSMYALRFMIEMRGLPLALFSSRLRRYPLHPDLLSFIHKNTKRTNEWDVCDMYHLRNSIQDADDTLPQISLFFAFNSDNYTVHNVLNMLHEAREHEMVDLAIRTIHRFLYGSTWRFICLHLE